MNKIGIFYAYWVHNWDVDCLPFIEKAAHLGFDILELNSGVLVDMNDSEKDRLKGATEKAGIELTFCTGLTPQQDIAAEDVLTRRNGIALLKKTAETMKYMGVKQLSGIVFGCWPTSLPPDAPDKRPYFERSVESMKEAIKTAEDCDVFFNVEAVNRFEHYMLNTCDEALDYVEQVGSDHCKILLDTFHMNIEEDSLHDAITKADGKLGHFHVGETNRRAPGRGRIPWDEVTSTLKAIAYQGSVVMEPFLMPGGEIGKAVSVHRDLRAGLDLDMEAKRALEFMRQKLA